jgi:16S rRNA (cytosine967-C5)-methyltransferase
MLNPAVIRLAATVIEQADRAHPADALLRQVLKRSRAEAELGRQVSRVVFAYYRWRGWVDTSSSMSRQLSQAWKLAEQFARNPLSVSAAELRQRAVPAWIWSELEAPVTWLRALQAEPVLWIRARPGQGLVLAKKLGCCRPAGPGPLADALQYRGTADLYRTPEFQAGAFEIQDINSQWVGWLCAPRPGQTWWDACAGQGGKLLHLADLMQNKGLIWASDRSLARLARLRRRAARARVFNYRWARWDGGARLPTRTRFDGVLVDAPCSSVGTWQRNPHARWTTTDADVRELSQVQLRLLLHAAAAVKPGGKLVYAVCTLTRSETVGVVEQFNQHCPDFSPLPLPDPFHPAAPSAPQLYAWPQDRGGQGMFVAAWQRQA